MCRGAGGRVFEAGSAALPQPLPLDSTLYTFFLAPGRLASLSSPGFWRKSSTTGCCPDWDSCRALALAFPPTVGYAPGLLRPGPMLWVKLKLLTQGQGFGHHLPCLPSGKLLAIASRRALRLALASRWPLLLNPPSHRSIPAHQTPSTSPQSNWTI
jgi:hypothetical protein